MYLCRLFRGIEIITNEEDTTSDINQINEELNQEYISDCIEGIKNLNY